MIGFVLQDALEGLVLADTGTPGMKDAIDRLAWALEQYAYDEDGEPLSGASERVAIARGRINVRR